MFFFYSLPKYCFKYDRHSYPSTQTPPHHARWNDHPFPTLPSPSHCEHHTTSTSLSPLSFLPVTAMECLTSQPYQKGIEWEVGSKETNKFRNGKLGVQTYKHFHNYNSRDFLVNIHHNCIPIDSFVVMHTKFHRGRDQTSQGNVNALCRCFKQFMVLAIASHPSGRIPLI